MADFDQINQSKADPRTPDEIRQAHIADLVDSLMVAFDSVNQLYIQKVAEQIAVIGTLNASSINRMAILAQMNEDIVAIKKQLERALQYTSSHLNDVLTEAFKELSGPQIYDDRVVQEQPRSSSLLKRIEQLARSIGRQTMETFRNLSNTSAITKGYMEAVDKAILATTSGLASYSEAIRDVIRELGSNGLKIEYGSGHTRRLDSAARSNVLSACNQIAQQGSDIVAEETGCDCKEITVHSCPAPDHAPVQGHVLKNEEWTKMQNGEDFEDINGQEFDGFRRPIGEWNCMHFGMAFDSRYQVPKYTAKQLNDILSQNEHGFYWRGRHYTMYQGTQMMRRYELLIRQQMDIAVAAKAAGDQVLQDQAQIQIEKLSADYESLSRASGIPMNPNRIRVEGFSRYDGPKHLEYSGPATGQKLLANTGEKIMGLNQGDTGEDLSKPRVEVVEHNGYALELKGNYKGKPRYKEMVVRAHEHFAALGHQTTEHFCQQIAARVWGRKPRIKDIADIENILSKEVNFYDPETKRAVKFYNGIAIVIEENGDLHTVFDRKQPKVSWEERK